MKSHASMNRIYRLVWNAALGIWVAVAENAKGRGKSGRAASALLSVLALLSPSAYAADAANASVVSGAGSVATSGLTTTINQTSQRLAIDWTQLSTAANEALRFNQPNAQAIALNRIIGSSPSSFLGSLTANGQVFILNPNGVLFGAGSQINVGGLVASTLAMSNADFMAGRNVFTNSGGTGSVVNKGSMTAASGGYLALLAPEVRNEGIMTASLGTALLAAGNKVTLNLDNGSLLGYSIDQGAINALAENKQLIKADGGQVLLSAKALDALTTATVNNTGVIEARTIQNKAGRILLMGDMEHGTVNVGGTLDASAPSGGDGGFIETSAAHVNVAVGTKVTTRVANGKTGKWLIDPNDFTIAASGGNMDAATVVSNLASTDFEIQTATMGTTGSGDINVNEALSWSSANTLTLTAQRNININQSITATSGGLTLNAANQISAPAAVNVGTFTLANGTWSQLGTLPAFSASDFRINGGTFIRALGGDGLSAGSAYQIADIYGLQGADSAGMLDKNYQLANNIDASGTVNWNNGAGFNPIGDSRPGHYFTGNLAGLGRTINNLTIYRPNSDYVGLFGWIGDPLLGVYQPGASSNAGNISNVGLVGGSVTGRAYVGPLVGSAFYGMITNSYASTTVAGISGSAYADSVGGLVGAAEGMQIRYSYATGNVTGGIRVGGLVGDFFNGRLMDSYASGEVRGVAMVGGLAGRYGSAGTGDPAAFGLIRSHATGDVIGDSSGSAYVGGLVGSTEIANFDLLTALYATGQVSGGTYVGGLIGLHSGGQFNNGYATGKVTATGDFVGGLIGLFEELGPSELGYVTASGNVRGANQVGGLIGGVGSSSYSRVGNIYEAYASGNVSGASHVGGLVGELNSGSVSNAYSTGDVSGTDGVGGLVGYNQKNISLSYASGAVTGTSNVGGLVGINPGGGTVTSSYWDTTTTGQSGSAGGVGLANSAAYSQASYSGLDLANVWYLKEGYTRPILRSEYTTVIRNAHQLQLVNLSASTLQSSYGYKLANDIDMSGLTRASDVWNTATGFVPLGDATTAFTGSFDGQNHTISNLFINRPTQDNVGLFGVTGSSANIRNLGLVDGSVTGNSSVGALVGRNQGRVSNSYATGVVTSVGDTVGGLVGLNEGAIDNTYSTADVNSYGGQYAGGLVGYQYNIASINNSYASGIVNSSDGGGGLVGFTSASTITNSLRLNDFGSLPSQKGGTLITGTDMLAASTFTGAGWSASNVGGDGKTWRVYEGQTGPLLRSFLTPLNLTPVFDGTASNPSNIGAYTVQGTPNSTNLLGPVANASDTLTLSNTATANQYIATVAANRYSHQQGYDLITHRVITTPGSAAGDVKLDNNISFANGALAMSSTGNIDLNGKAITGSGSSSYLLINGGTAINAGAVSVDSFAMFDGTWNQSVTTLPSFTARDFTIFGGTFIRAKGGDGSATPYQIADIYGLQGAGSAGMLGKNYTLANNIDASGTANWNNLAGFNPIGDGNLAFSGSFDGNNKTITGLSIDRAATDYVGLFGAASTRATVSNVGLVGGSVSGNSNVGALVGDNHGSISGSYASTNVTGAGDTTGGLLGFNSGAIDNSHATGIVIGHAWVGGLTGQSSGAVSNSHATGVVNGDNFVGGLVGQNNGGGVITNSYATTGQVTATGYHAGGLIGYNASGGSAVTNSYATGNVTGLENVGGLIGYTEATAITNSYATGRVSATRRTAGGLVGTINAYGSTVVSNSYSTGDVSGPDGVGGLVGENDGGVRNSYSTGNVSGNDRVGGLVGFNVYGSVSDSYSIGRVNGVGATGGLVGYNGNGSINNSYSTGNVNNGIASIYVGGLVGRYYSGSVSDSFWDVTKSGQTTSAGGTGKTTAEMTHAATFAGWNIDGVGGTGSIWRIYEGNAGNLGPLLRSFLTTYNVTPTFNGGASTPANIGAYSTTGADPSKLLGTAATNDTLTLASTGTANTYSATSSASGHYSIQQGYDITATRTITTSGHAAGDIKLDHDISFTNGALVMSATGNIDLNSKAITGTNGFMLMNRGTAINAGAVSVDAFLMLGGTWDQSIPTLPGFAARDFTIAGGTFIRAKGGDGSTLMPYQIADVYGLQGAGSAGMLGKHYQLANNIDASGTSAWNNLAGFNPIGDGNLAFSGSFDGNNKTITGLNIDRASTDGVGLFGIADTSASISNVGLMGASITGDRNVGALVGINNGGSISNASSTTGIIISNNGYAGGLVGGNFSGNISNAYSTGSVNGNSGSYTGGLVGVNNSGSISNAYSTSSVNGTDNTGGLVGGNFNGNISDAYSTGSVNGTNNTGGLVGLSFGGSISNAYSTGSVNNGIASSNVGGLVGQNSSGSVTDSFWNTDTSGQATSALGTGISDGYMKEASTFTNWSIASTGGSGAIWRIYAGYTEPLLRSFLTPLLVQPSYDGNGAALNIAGSLALPAGTDMSKISGSVRDGTTLTLTSNGLAGSYTASASTWGLYSGQQGYDMSSAVRTISTPGSAVGDIKLGSNISFTDGTLIMFATGYIDLNGKAITASGSNSFLQINGGTAINAGAVSVDSFLMMDGTWSQVAPTLPGFAARDFSLWGGTFIRAKGGDGSTLTPYQIADVYGLQGVDSLGMADKHYKLANNVDASGTAAWNSGFGFNPIGTVAGSFTGTFDGMGHAISGLSIDRPGTDLVGLFSATSGSAAIRNVGLVGGSVKGHNDVGALVGRNQTSITGSYASTDVTGFVDVGGLVGLSIYGSISDSHADGVVNGAGSVGGLVGYSLVSAISHSYATGNVIGRDYVGGLIGRNGYYNTTGSISDSYATGNVTGRHRLGGLVGGHLSNTITNSYATGTVNGSGSGIGGLVGELSYATISNSYYGTGSVTGSSDTGGLVGTNDSGVVTNSFWDKQTSSQATSAGGTGKTSAEMMQAATFTGWDMASAGGSTHIWRIYEGNAGHVGPLLRSFLTAKALTGTTLTYNGATQSDAFTLTAGIYGNVASGRNAGTYTSSLYSDQTGYDLSGSGTLTIDKANVVVKAGDVTKTYDGGLSASGAAVAASGTQLFTTDTATGGSFAFIDKNAGLGNKTVTVSGVTVNDGNSGNNYNVSYVDNTTSTITPKALTVSGLTASNKTYDQGTSATVSTAGALYTGLIGGDAVSVSATGAFTDKNAATGKTVNVTSGYTGADVHNYAITNQTTTTADIAQKALSVSAITAANKVYDQGTGASVNTAGAVLGGLMAGDAVTVSATGLFIDKHVATGKTVNLSSNYTGADVGNYTITSQASTAASITQKALTVSGVTAGNKLYDRTTSAVVSTAGAIYGGLIGGDDLSVGSTGGFTDKNAADGKTVILSSSYTGADVGNYFITDQATTTANVTPKALTISGVTAGNKVYDGHTGAQTNSLFAAYGGLIVGDAVTVSSSGVFDSKNAASGKTVILASGYTGADVGNYVITDQAFAAANITPKALTVSGITVANKTYDQGTGATVSTAGAVYGGLIAGDVLAVNATGIFLDKHAANGKTVNLSSNYTGADVNNYAITDQASTSANITQKALTIWGVTASNKVYDQGVGATVSAVGAVYSGLIGGDALTVSATGGFLDKNAANGKSVNLTSGYTGADVGNYAITNQATTTANITPKDLSVTAAAQHKTYDATPVATLAYTDNRIAGDSLSFSSSASFIDKNVGTAKTVYFSSLTQTGTDAGNYTLASPTSGTSHANITPAALLITANNDSRQAFAPYSGGNGVVYNGLVGGETASVLAGALTYGGSSQGASAAGTYAIKPGGQASSNYTITFTNGTLTLTPASAAASALGGSALSDAYISVLVNVAGVGKSSGSGDDSAAAAALDSAAEE